MNLLKDFTQETDIDINNAYNCYKFQYETETTKRYLNTIFKYNIFFKYLYEYNKSFHYYNSMIYNSLMCLKCLESCNKHIFYQMYRSYIENTIRFILKLEDGDTTTVMKLFRRFKKEITSLGLQESIYSTIEDEYSYCCNYVHSNINADIKIDTYIKEINANFYVSKEDLEESLERLNQFMDNAILITLHKNSSDIKRIFNRKISLLKYLIGDDKCEIILKD